MQHDAGSIYPPAQNQYMQENILEEFIFARIHVGPVFALAQIHENIFEELFLKYVFAPSQVCIRTFASSMWIQWLYAHTLMPIGPIHKIYFWGVLFGASTCGACIRTQANKGNYSWRIVWVLVSCQRVCNRSWRSHDNVKTQATRLVGYMKYWRKRPHWEKQ